MTYFSPTYVTPLAEKFDKKNLWQQRGNGKWNLKYGQLKLPQLDNIEHKDEVHPTPLLTRHAQLKEGLETRVTLNTKADSHITGLIWYYDDQNYLNFFKKKNNTNMTIYYSQMINSKISHRSHNFFDNDVELRLTYNKKTVFSYFRPTDSIYWISMGSFQLPPHPPNQNLLVGINAYHEEDISSLSNFQQN